ncbi:MAG: response regulator [Selenomonadaceae bacterium]|nr:response regulator [Selenomonadaceae bacterium]
MAKRGTADSKSRNNGRPCAGCGKMIQTGLYCPACLEKFRDKAKTQSKRIEFIKSSDLKKVAANRHEVLILIAISDDRNLSITKIILERSLSKKYQILAVNNPLNAINTLISRVINLVILDADFNGVDMLRRIRSDDRFKDTPIMMMSGSTKRELVAEIFSLGVQDYVAKPCEPKDLVERIDKMIGDTEESNSFTEEQQKSVFNITLIDDDIFDLRQERDTIKNRFPCEINTAQSAVEGMKLLESNGADLILVSLDMPFVNGIKFLSLVKENAKLKNIPVIIMTDSRDFSVLSEIEKSAAAGHIKKPAINEEGLALIEEKLRRRR